MPPGCWSEALLNIHNGGEEAEKLEEESERKEKPHLISMTLIVGAVNSKQHPSFHLLNQRAPFKMKKMRETLRMH